MTNCASATLPISRLTIATQATTVEVGAFVTPGFIFRRRDRYGHTLAYAFLGSEVLLNAEIIRHGYGFVYTRFPFARVQEFRELEREAREQRRGLWRVL